MVEKHLQVPLQAPPKGRAVSRHLVVGTLSYRLRYSLLGLDNVRQGGMVFLLTCGFQSLSYRMQVSAVCRLTPRPPAAI